jgi:class 3 adenylate cyclase
METRLAEVLAAEIAGYGLLMGRDEEGTLTQLKAFRTTLVEFMIAAHRARMVRSTGDGVLVEFASTVDAAGCNASPSRIQRLRHEKTRGGLLRAGVHDFLDDAILPVFCPTSQTRPVTLPFARLLIGCLD